MAVIILKYSITVVVVTINLIVTPIVAATIA